MADPVPAAHRRNSGRCFDCFMEFAVDDDRFAVLKKMRDIPENWHGDDIARAQLDSLCHDQVFVCEDCAGWYGDHPIRVAAHEIA